MKIAFTGTHSTGKTTLAKKMQQALDLPFLGNITRRLAQTGAQLNKSDNSFSQLLVFTEHINNFNNKNFICDRSVFDALAYSIYNCEYSGLAEHIVLTGETLVQHYKDRYDFLFYLPIANCPFVKDGMREDDALFRIAVDEILLHLFNKYKPTNLYIVQSKTVEERICEINNIIKENESRIFN